MVAATNKRLAVSLHVVPVKTLAIEFLAALNENILHCSIGLGSATEVLQFVEKCSGIGSLALTRECLSFGKEHLFLAKIYYLSSEVRSIIELG